MSKRRRRGMKKSFPVQYSSDRVKVSFGVNKLVHSDLYRKKKLDQDAKLWAATRHPDGEPRLAVLQRISDFLQGAPREHMIVLERAEDKYMLAYYWWINEHRQKVYAFVRMFNTARTHTIERSITYLSWSRADYCRKNNQITWQGPPLDLLNTPRAANRERSTTAAVP
jgi:hypothetical protein